ncbi:MAG: urea ABC transporter ATP-binding subunit UrtE [Anaerolineae bacterium]|nr:urea ABC transporter ATP-binding subunit UrtE [Anaerolineae bacterium]
MMTIEHLNVSYGESRILNDVSLEIPSGQVVCLMGRNGVGKTTLLKSIMGLLRSTSGSITFDGKDITKAPPHKRAKAGIGYVPQGRGIFPYLSVYDNLMMGLEALDNPKDNAIEEMYTQFPIIKSMSKRTAGTLSGGQQQQLAIARALVRRPKLLLLDEPTEGIQPSIVAEIEELIFSLQKQGNMSILLVEQFLDFALRIANECYVMEKGSIVMKGEPSTLNESVIKEYLAV